MPRPRTTVTCTAPGCSRQSRAGGLCHAHYQQRLRGRDVERVCRDLGARFPDAIFNRENGRVRYEFRDGSAIIVQSGYAWDLRHPKCTCGWCWDSNGAALPGCARAE